MIVYEAKSVFQDKKELSDGLSLLSTPAGTGGQLL